MSRQDSTKVSDVKILLKTGVDGRGISTIEKTGNIGLVDTYTITFDDGTKTTFTVTNGNGITSIEYTSTEGLVDTYTITFDDGATETFTVTNGNGISSIEKTGTSGVVDTYTITFDDGTTTTFTVTNGNGSTAHDINYDNTSSKLLAINVQDAIDETMNRISLNGINILFIMDSYGTIQGSNGYLDEEVSDITGANCYRVAQSGAGLYNGNFKSAFEAWTGDFSSIDIVVLIGGANDQLHVNGSDASTLSANMDALISSIKSHCTNAYKIMIMCAGMTFNTASAYYYASTRIKLAKLYKDGAIRNGCVYVDNSQYILRNTALLVSDKVHPNTDGMNELIKHTVNALYTGHVSVHYELDTTLTTHETTPRTINVTMIRNNGTATLIRNDASGAIVQNLDSNTYDGSEFDFGSLADTLIETENGAGEFASNFVGYVNNGTNDVPLRGAVVIRNRHLYGYFKKVSGGSATGQPMSGVGLLISND